LIILSLEANIRNVLNDSRNGVLSHDDGGLKTRPTAL
jgi:hypothetical protein